MLTFLTQETTTDEFEGHIVKFEGFEFIIDGYVDINVTVDKGDRETPDEVYADCTCYITTLMDGNFEKISVGPEMLQKIKLDIEGTYENLEIND